MELLRISASSCWSAGRSIVPPENPPSSFSGYNDIALSVLFKDVMHFKPTVEFELLRRMLEIDTRECPAKMRMIDKAGFRADRDTICDVLVAQQKQMRAAVKRESFFTEAARQALIARGFSPDAFMTKSQEPAPVSGTCIASRAK